MMRFMDDASKNRPPFPDSRLSYPKALFSIRFVYGDDRTILKPEVRFLENLILPIRSRPAAAPAPERQGQSPARKPAPVSHGYQGLLSDAFLPSASVGGGQSSSGSASSSIVTLTRFPRNFRNSSKLATL